MAGLANGSLTDGEQLGAALDQLLTTLLTSPAGNQVAGWLSDLLDKASTWLHTPIGTSPSGNGTSTSPGGGADLGAAIGSILGNISSTVGGITNATANGTADAGQIAGSVVDGVAGVLGERAGGRGSPCAFLLEGVGPCCPRPFAACGAHPADLFAAPPPPALPSQTACWAPSPAAAAAAAPPLPTC